MYMLFLFRIRNLWRRHKAERLMVDTSILQVHAREVSVRALCSRFADAGAGEENNCPRKKTTRGTGIVRRKRIESLGL